MLQTLGKPRRRQEAAPPRELWKGRPGALSLAPPRPRTSSAASLVRTPPGTSTYIHCRTVRRTVPYRAISYHTMPCHAIPYHTLSLPFPLPFPFPSPLPASRQLHRSCLDRVIRAPVSWCSEPQRTRGELESVFRGCRAVLCHAMQCYDYHYHTLS